MRRFVCGVAKRPAGLAMDGLRRQTKSRQGAKPNSAKPTQVGSSTRRLSCIAHQRLPILSHSTPHSQPPHLYKCGGSHVANNEEPRSELHFAAIEPCSAKTSAARSRQPFIPASSIAASHGRNADIGQTITPSSRVYACSPPVNVIGSDPIGGVWSGGVAGIRGGQQLIRLI